MVKLPEVSPQRKLRPSSALPEAITCEEAYFSIFIFKDSLQQLPVWTVLFLQRKRGVTEAFNVSNSQL